MKDNLNARAGFGANRRIGQVALDEFHRLKASQVGALAGNEAVDAAHRFATLEKRRSNGAANKAGSSGDKISETSSYPEKNRPRVRTATAPALARILFEPERPIGFSGSSQLGDPCRAIVYCDLVQL